MIILVVVVLPITRLVLLLFLSLDISTIVF